MIRSSISKLLKSMGNVWGMFCTQSASLACGTDSNDKCDDDSTAHCRQHVVDVSCKHLVFVDLLTEDVACTAAVIHRVTNTYLHRHTPQSPNNHTD